jgi:hypothetical protein
VADPTWAQVIFLFVRRNYIGSALLTQKPTLAHPSMARLYLVGLSIGFLILVGALTFLAFSL